MQPTYFGLAVLPLALISLNQPVRLLQLVLLCSVFEGAAFAIIGGEAGVGLPPATAPALLFLGYISLQYLLGMRYPGEAPVLKTLAPFLILVVYALATAVVLPEIFSYQIMIWPQKLEFFDQGAVQLKPDGSNKAQCVYLALNALIATFGSLYLTRGGINYRAIVRAYLGCGYLAAGLAWWQLAARVAGVPYPDDFLYSNPGWLILTEQTLGGLPRINGPFSEPAALATYLSGTAFASLWLCVRGHKVMAPRLLLAVSIVTVFLSTSTTGIVVITIGLPLALAFAVGRGDRKGVIEAGRTLGGLLAGAIILLGPLILIRPELIDMVGTIMEGTLNKGGSDSFAERSAADLDAINAAFQTYGLGVGWGMFRSSSLIPGLMSNGGVVGLSLIAWFASRVIGLSRQGVALLPDHPGRVAIDCFSGALAGLLAAAVVSAPGITSMSFFLELACVIGASARMIIDARCVSGVASHPDPRPSELWAGGTVS